QAVGPALAELERAVVDEGPAGPRAAGIVDDEPTDAELGHGAGARDGAAESLFPRPDIEASAAGAEDQVALERVPARLGADLPAVLKQNGQGRAAGAGFAPEFSAGGRDGARGLHHYVILD